MQFSDFTQHWSVSLNFSAASIGGSQVTGQGQPGTATAYGLTMLDNSNNPVSYVDLFASTPLWFYPEGSAVQ